VVGIIEKSNNSKNISPSKMEKIDLRRLSLKIKVKYGDSLRDCFYITDTIGNEDLIRYLKVMIVKDGGELEELGIAVIVNVPEGLKRLIIRKQFSMS
jgi:hypothetical protein